MGDENELDTEETTEEAEPESSGNGEGEPRMYTEAELKAHTEAIVKKRLARERRKSRTPKPKRHQPKDAGPTGDAEPISQAEMFDLIEDFRDAIDGLGIPKGTQRRMRKEFLQQRPEDLDAWVNGWGYGGDEQPDNPSDDAEEETDPEPPKMSKTKAAAAAPSEIPDTDTMRDPNKLTRDSIERLESKHGKRKAQKLIREMVESWYRDRPVVIHDR